ncbi:Uncharacterised protein [uncultured archaeon]|nr:Uncharacterised protein [uncultured archaeon]
MKLKIRYKFTIVLILASIFIVGASAQGNLTLTGTSVSQTVTAGTNATYVINLTNTGTLVDNYTVISNNPDSATSVGLNITSPQMLNPGQSLIFALNVSNLTAGGPFRVNVTANSTNDPGKIAFVNTTTTVTALPVNGTNLISVTPVSQTVTAGTNATYVLDLTNTGTLVDNYTVIFNNPDSAISVGLNITSPQMLNPGQSLIFALKVSNLTAGGPFRVNVTANSTNDPSKIAFINTTTTVVTAVQTEVNATVKISPRTLNLKSKGKFTAFISLPSGFNVTDIIPGTVMCDGAQAVNSKFSEKNRTLIVKFNRQDLVNVPTGNAVTLTVTGKISSNGTLLDFQGSDKVRVINNGKSKELDEKNDGENENLNNNKEDNETNSNDKDIVKDKKVDGKDSNDNKKNNDTKAVGKDSKNKGKDKESSNGKNKGKK